MKTLAFGEVLWDIYPQSKHLGGAPLNFSGHFKKCGGESFIVTAVGTDALGKEALDKMLKLGIQTEYVTFCENKETGKCIVTLDENKKPAYNLLNNVAYDDIKMPAFYENTFDVLYFGTLSLRNQNNARVLKKILSENKFQHTFVDINIRSPYYSESVVRFAMENATIIKISDEELPIVMNVLGKSLLTDTQCAKALSEAFNNLKIIIITKGAEGAFVYDSAIEKIYESKAKKVKVVSTVGAGDSFSASFLAKYLQTNDIECALSLATEISGFVVGCIDAIPDYRLSDVESTKEKEL